MQTFTTKEKLAFLFSFPVIVAALGYFVDIYDLLLFGIVRVPSMKTLGLDIDTAGTHIINFQMTGLLLGGILWGILGDKKGRLSVLFGSILVYSLANIACGFLPQFPVSDKLALYEGLRFLAGIGLAGELGAGITLVSESLPKELRAIGTSLVAGFGLLGAVVANLTVELAGNWTYAYFIGGGLGLALLLLRVGVLESGLYKNLEKELTVSKGNFFSFFTNRNRFVKYMKCIAIGLPTWFCIGILAMMANQFAPVFGITNLNPGKAIMWAYVGVSAGDFASGFISHWLAFTQKSHFLHDALYAARHFTAAFRRDQNRKHILFLLRLAGLRDRLLGHVRNGSRRAVWHQHPEYGDDDCTQRCARHGSGDAVGFRLF